ncbi:MAG TPA: PTS transporter subunit IIC [Promineifilum sp.]|nr:PTS transporter subunit IIC [Promineifilum sp.]HRO89086.1 PTS transporter subunit IIC [Promineifilum sp.]HRQ12769.1 PTS transporter subunit IIC [Promineifilum sp.]
MDTFLNAIKSVFDNLGATVLLPIIIFFLALALGTKPGRAFRSAITIGIAFIGINLVFGLMWSTLTEVGQAMVTNTGLERNVIDVGWPAAAAIAFATQVGLWVIPIAILVNVVLLLARLTKTLNIDVWNFWHFAFIGSFVAIASKNFALGLFAAAVAAAWALFFGDWVAKAIQHFYGLPGISIPHMTTGPGVPFAVATNWVIERIPGANKINWDPDSIQKRWGVFGDPIVLGLLIGLGLGLLAFYNVGSLLEMTVKVLQTAMNLAAVMLLLPRMVQILMEGLIPISEAARDFLQKRASNREIYIGLDSAILIGHPSAISATLLLVPIAILLSLILPGNQVILFADLAVIPFVVAGFAPIMRGNIFRMVIAGIVVLGLGFYIGTALAPSMTAAAVEANFTMPEGAAQIISIADGFLWPPFVFHWLGRSLGWIGIGLLAVLVLVVMYFFQRNPGPWERLAGAPAEGED